MNIQINAVNFSVDIKLEEFIYKIINKLRAIDRQIVSVEVFLNIDKSQYHKNKIVKIKLNSTDSEYFAKKKTNTFEKSADLVSKALRKQIIKNKSK